MTKTEKRLTVLAKWLKTDNNYYDERDGALERAIKNAVQEVKESIGEQLEEILDADDEQLENFLKDCTNELLDDR